MGFTEIAAIVTALLTVLSSVFGVKYKKYKDWFGISVKVLDDLDEAIQDDSITKKEIREIAKRVKKPLK